jgi:hypothetical protein
MTHGQRDNPLCPGFALRFGARSARWGHYLGGSHSIRGAQCPNCEKPLIQYLSLNVRDPRLNLDSLGVERLSLLSCMRCALCFRKFEYQLHGTTQIAILRAHLGERMWEDWYRRGIGDELEQLHFDLSPIPEHIQDLHRRMTEGYQPTQSEELEIAQFTGNFANPDVGGYPIVDGVNQIGGLTFFTQPIRIPRCTQCAWQGTRRRMSFLASLVDNDRLHLRIGIEGVQVLFFLCPDCRVICVIHCM